MPDIKDINKKIGNRIQTSRLLSGLTQEQLAEKVGISLSCLSRLETGKTMVSIKKLNQISIALDIGIESLLCDLFLYDNATVTDPILLEILNTLSRSPDSLKLYTLRNIQLSLDCFYKKPRS